MMVSPPPHWRRGNGGPLVTTHSVRTFLLFMAAGYIGFMARTVRDSVEGSGIGGIVDKRNLLETIEGGSRSRKRTIKARDIPPEAPTKKWERTKFTRDDFVVAGVNLGTYEMNGAMARADPHSVAPFELYEDFDIADLITGNEGWWDLVKYRQKLRRPSLPFYIDKVAQRRWLPAVRGIPITKPWVLKYKSDLTESGKQKDEESAIKKLLPKEGSFVAKPTHMSCSKGVWLVKLQGDDEYPLTARGGHELEEDQHWHRGQKMAEELTDQLHKTQGKFESWALRQVKPGLAIEERFTADGIDEYPAMEFKMFTIWGRVWLSNWKRGSDRWGFIYRDGTVVDWSGYREDHATLPDYVDWDRVIEIAETLGAHKDMYRTDIFVGVPAGALPKDASPEEQKKATRIVVSETELHPTTEFNDKGLFEEAARLWIAGYRTGNYKVVANDEVPQAFLEKGWLSEEDVAEMTTLKTA